MRKKTTLTIEVEYDDTKTDPESLCHAMDHVAASGLLHMAEPLESDGYGEIRLDKRGFLVERMIELECEVSGGVLIDVRHASAHDKRPLSYSLIDHDIEEDDDEVEEGPHPLPGGGVPADE